MDPDEQIEHNNVTETDTVEEHEEPQDVEPVKTNVKMTDIFIEYTDLYTQIKTAREEMKMITERMKELEQKVGDHMDNGHIDVLNINTSNGSYKFMRTKSKQSKALNKEFLKETLLTKVDAKIAEELSKDAFEKRPTTEVEKIKFVPSKPRK